MKSDLNIIGIGFKPSQLRGIGTEYLVVNGTVIAKFWNGMIIASDTIQVNSEKTITAVYD